MLKIHGIQTVRQSLSDAVALLSPRSDPTHEGDSHRSNDSRDPTLTLDMAGQAALLHSRGRGLAHPPAGDME